jgi:hypothetical protein
MGGIDVGPLTWWTQVRVLLWKNFLLIRRRPQRVLLEILLPCSLLLAVGFLKLAATVQNAPEGWSTFRGPGEDGHSENLFQPEFEDTGNVMAPVKPLVGLMLPRYNDWGRPIYPWLRKGEIGTIVFPVKIRTKCVHHYPTTTTYI